MSTARKATAFDRRALLIGAVAALDEHLAKLPAGDPPSAPFLASILKTLPPDRVETVADVIRGELEEELASSWAADDRHD